MYASCGHILSFALVEKLDVKTGNSKVVDLSTAANDILCVSLQFNLFRNRPYTINRAYCKEYPDAKLAGRVS